MLCNRRDAKSRRQYSTELFTLVLKTKLWGVLPIPGMDEMQLAEARAAGADLVLNKPFTGEQLLASVKQLLG